MNFNNQTILSNQKFGWKAITLLIIISVIAVFSSCNKDDDEPMDTTPPDEVTNFMAMAGDGQVILSWDAPTDMDVQKFSLTYTPNSPTTPIVLDAQTTSTSISNLVNGTEYTFTLSTVDANGNTSSGVHVSATPEEPVGILFAEDFENTCSQDGTPDGWVVYSETSNRDWVCIELVSGFSVNINAFGGDEASRDWLISPTFVLEESNNRVLTFDYAVRYADVSGFGLEVRISTDYGGSGDPSTATWTTLDAGINNELNSDDQIPSTPVSLSDFNGMAYVAFYYTSSGTGAGEGTRVSVNNVKVGATDSEDTFAPGNVSNFGASPDDESITLSWVAPNDSDLAGFNLSYSPSGASMTLGASETSYIVTGLTNGTEYTFTLSAFDHSGNESSGVSIMATPEAPIAAMFSEDFDDACSAVGEAPTGWTIYSAASDRDWLCSDRNGEFGMEVNGFGGDAGSADWLISPAIELNAGNGSLLSFYYSQRFSDEAGFGLEARISTDYGGSGDPTSATWTTLDAGIAPTDDDMPVPSSAVSLSAYSGDVYIAFYYTSSSGSSAYRVTLDNVSISSSLLSENFDTGCTAVGEAPAGWTIYSAASDRDWLCSDRNGEFGMEVNGFGGDAGSADWLISPSFELLAGNTSMLSFYYSQRFSDEAGFGLEARISTDYSGSGDPGTATWTTLDAGIAPTDDDVPVPSSLIPLLDFSGNAYIAFYYTSSSGSSAYRVTLDNVSVSN